MTVIRRVANDQWPTVAWLWQAYRNDLAEICSSVPRADGRYNHSHLDAYEGSRDHVGYLAWEDEGPVGFALVHGLVDGPRSIGGFYVVPFLRRSGLGRRLALDVIERHPAPWTIAFQRDNLAAGRFWRAVATEAFGEGWTEDVRPVPGKPDVPPDHWITTT